MSDEVFDAEVTQLFGRTGPGGQITICQLKLLSTGRHLQRAVAGPVRVGDVLKLMDCEREHRRGRF